MIMMQRCWWGQLQSFFMCLRMNYISHTLVNFLLHLGNMPQPVGECSELPLQASEGCTLS